MPSKLLFEFLFFALKAKSSPKSFEVGMDMYNFFCLKNSEKNMTLGSKISGNGPKTSKQAIFSPNGQFREK